MIKVLKTVFQVFELLADKPTKGFSCSEIAKEVGINNTTCNNILRTMLMSNYLEQEGVRAGYRLGPMVFKIGHSINYQEYLTGIVKPHAEKFTERTNESSNLVILRNCHRFILLSVFCEQTIQAKAEIRPDDKLYVSATARTLMAYANKEEMKIIVERNGEPTEKDWPEAAGRLEEELAEIRQRGYGLANNAVENIAGGASPIFQNGKVVAVLGYWLPMYRHSQELENKLIALLKEECVGISADL